MTRFLVAIALIVGASGLWFGAAQPAKDDAKAKAEAKLKDMAEAQLKDAAKAVMDDLFKNWAAGEATKSREAFLSDEMPVSNVWHYQKPTTRQRKAGDFLKDVEKEKPGYLKLASTEVDLVTNGYAVARMSYVGGGSRGKAVAVLVSDGKTWRIASLAFHEWFNW